MTKKIGIIGGGQLGSMLTQAAHALNLHVTCLENTLDCPAARHADILVADYEDFDALEHLVGEVDCLTYESENIPVHLLKHLEKIIPIRPSIEALTISQDRLLEKQCLNQLGISTAAFFAVNKKTDVEQAKHELGLPFILKTRRFGYDGKGQWLFTVGKEPDSFDEHRTIAEAFVDFDRELSLI